MLYLLILIYILLLIYGFCWNFEYINFLFYILLFQLLVSFINIFCFIKRSSSSLHSTSEVQRFWVLSFFLFWVLELIVFVIFIYLFLNVTQEIWYMDLYLTVNIIDQSYNTVFNFTYRWIILFMFFGIVLYIHNYDIISHISLFIIFLILLDQLFSELNSFIWINSLYELSYVFYDSSEDTWSFESSIILLRPILHYSYVFALLKLWHIIFILGVYLFFIIFTISYTNNKFLSYNILSFLINSCLLLFIFYIFNYGLFVKLYTNDIIFSIYYEMNCMFTNLYLVILKKLTNFNYFLI